MVSAAGVPALTAIGFASVYIARQDIVSTASLTYAGFFFGNIPWIRGNLTVITLGVMFGVLLVFTSLIVPALATAGMHGRGRLSAAYAIGAAGYISGLVLSAVLDLPSGALIVWTLAGCALLAQLVPAVRRSHPAHVAPEAVFDTRA